MEFERLEQVFRNQIDAYAARDVDRLIAGYPEDCILRDMSDPDTPFLGRRAVRGFLEGYFAELDDFDVEITSVVAAGEIVCGELDVRASFVAEPHSHQQPRRVRLHYCVLDWVTQHGLIAEERFYWDAATLQAQLAA